MADWSEIPDNIIALFVKHLPYYAEDFSRFSAVCKRWRSVALEREHMKIPRFGPWLMLQEDNSNNNDTDGGKELGNGNANFYSISSNQFFNIELSPALGKKHWGSPYGWIVTIGFDLVVHLLNPLTAAKFSLPSLHTVPLLPFESGDFDYCYHAEPGCPNSLHKMVLSSNPCSWNYPPDRAAYDQCCMAIYGKYQLAFAFLGDEAWTTIDTSGSSVGEVLLYRGHIYVVTIDGRLMICEVINTPHPKATYIVEPPRDYYYHGRSPINNKFYLVEISGNLHMVERCINHRLPWKTEYFEVHRFDFNDTKWTRVSNFGDNHALFVGLNASFAISISDYPEFKGNCIYFTYDLTEYYPGNLSDIGIYHYADDTVEEFCSDNHTFVKLLRSIFFMPSL